jgi:hypothetical protein
MAAVAVLFLVFWGGCGTGDYEKKLDDRISKLKMGSKFILLSSPIDVSGTQVSLRIPQKNDSNQKAFENLPTGSSGGFEGPPLQEAVGADGKPIDPKRLKPNVLEVADLKLTYEGFVPDQKQGKLPYYLYVAVSTRQNRGNIPKIMQADLASKLKDATPLADGYKAQTPEGGDIVWQECQATGKHLFYYVKPDGQSQFVQLNGTIQLMFHDENDALVILIWRWPAGVDQYIKSWMEMTAGCVKVTPKTPAPGGE